MTSRDRQKWELRHAVRLDLPPRETLQWVPPGNGGFAVDVACGQGRHVPVLLDRGYHVVAVDIARAAIDRVRNDVARGHHHLSCLQADLDAWPFRPLAFDLIVMVDFLDRRLLPALFASTAHGGHILIDTFAVNPRGNANGPRSADYLLHNGELENRLAGWTIVHRQRDDGDDCREAMLARKP